MRKDVCHINYVWYGSVKALALHDDNVCLLRQVTCKAQLMNYSVHNHTTSAEQMLVLHTIIYTLQFGCQETSLLTIKHLQSK